MISLRAITQQPQEKEKSGLNLRNDLARPQDAPRRNNPEQARVRGPHMPYILYDNDNEFAVRKLGIDLKNLKFDNSRKIEFDKSTFTISSGTVSKNGKEHTVFKITPDVPPNEKYLLAFIETHQESNKRELGWVQHLKGGTKSPIYLIEQKSPKGSATHSLEVNLVSTSLIAEISVGQFMFGNPLEGLRPVDKIID